MTDCIFCKIVQRKIPAEIIYEDDLTIAFMDAFPVAEGHLLLIPKTHAENLLLIPDDTLEVILKNLKKIVKAAQFSDYNILQNNGEKAGQTVFHAHFHLIPRNVNKIGFSYSFAAFKDADQKSAAEKIKSNFS